MRVTKAYYDGRGCVYRASHLDKEEREGMTEIEAVNTRRNDSDGDGNWVFIEDRYILVVVHNTNSPYITFRCPKRMSKKAMIAKRDAVAKMLNSASLCCPSM